MTPRGCANPPEINRLERVRDDHDRNFLRLLEAGGLVAKMLGSLNSHP